MFSMNELVDLKMQQQIAHEIYRHQIMQRIPDPFPAMIPLPMPPHHMIMPPRDTLPGSVSAKLENNELWKRFHEIGTEMIITKSGRRMFPSMRVSLSGLEEESNYCVLLEMVPIGDCRYKFSGSHWVPAGGAEPQSPQRMFLHPDSPTTGAHWQSQAILFNKVKLTNNTLDSNGHIVLASMHKYQPRLHIIRTSDLNQLLWAPQQAFIFPETEFVAVTAYQNDRITKLKIDNNPFAKGFRETGQSRCKRKMGASSGADESSECVDKNASTSSLTSSDDDRSSISSFDGKRSRSADSCDDELLYSSRGSTGSVSPQRDDFGYHPAALASMYGHHQHLMHASAMEAMAAAAYFASSHPILLHPQRLTTTHPLPTSLYPNAVPMAMHHVAPPVASLSVSAPPSAASTAEAAPALPETPASVSPAATTSVTPDSTSSAPTSAPLPDGSSSATVTTSKRNNFSISAILAY